MSQEILEAIFETNFFDECTDNCSTENRWSLVAPGLHRIGCYDCGWCRQVLPVE